MDVYLKETQKAMWNSALTSWWTADGTFSLLKFKFP
jgi:hypothetical protein